MRYIFLIILFFSFNISANEYSLSEICPTIKFTITERYDDENGHPRIKIKYLKKDRLISAKFMQSIWTKLNNHVPRLSPSEKEYIMQELRITYPESPQRYMELRERKEWHIYQFLRLSKNLLKRLEWWIEAIEKEDLVEEARIILLISTSIDGIIDYMISMAEYEYFKISEKKLDKESDAFYLCTSIPFSNRTIAGQILYEYKERLNK
jgi:hypothetical protein